MKNFLYILLFSLPLLSIGQSDSVLTEKKVYKESLDLDINYLGIELNYKRKILNKFSIGAGLGGGFNGFFTLNKDFKEEDVAEILDGKIFIDYKLSNKFHFHIAYKVALVANSYSYSGGFYGAELGFFYVIKGVEVGIKPVYGTYQNLMLTGGNFIGIPLFLIKVHLSKW